MPNHELNTIEHRLTPINTHLNCRRCDYDLISLFPGDPCPECGTEIILSTPNTGMQRFENHPASRLPLLIAGAGGGMIAWPIIGIIYGDSPLFILLGLIVIPLVTLSIAFVSMRERRLAVTVDWNKRQVIYEHCYRTNAYWGSFRRLKYHACRMDEILSANIQSGRGSSNLRVIHKVGIAFLPDSIEDWFQHCNQMNEIAAATPEPALHRRTWFISVLAISVLVVLFSGILFWFLVIDPV